MTEEERAGSERRRFERTQMMQALQTAFGEVVDAAIAGDFTKRVEAEFPDPELNALAASRQQPGRDRRSRRVARPARCWRRWRAPTSPSAWSGDYQGAFERLKTDTNAVADKLTEIVGQLRETSRTLKIGDRRNPLGRQRPLERTTKQAATIEETSAAMEQLASTVLQNAQRAKDASGVAARRDPDRRRGRRR